MSDVKSCLVSNEISNKNNKIPTKSMVTQQQPQTYLHALSHQHRTLQL